MRRWMIICFATTAVGCSSVPGSPAGKSEGAATRGAGLPDSPTAAAMIASYQATFPGAKGARKGSQSILAATPVDHFERVGAQIRPVLSASLHRSANHPASVMLPATADGRVMVKDADSAMSLQVALDGAVAAPAQVAQGFAVYPKGHASGADVIHRVTAHGTEDFLDRKSVV